LPFRNYWLVYPPRAEGQRNVKAFSDWIRAEAAAFAGPDASLSTT